jgi:tetratricopeptide (TPR) repeat protein
VAEVPLEDAPRRLIGTLESWRGCFETMGDQAPEVMRLLELVISADELVPELRRALGELVEASDDGRRVVREVVEHEHALAKERHARIRWEPIGIELLLEEIRAAFAKTPKQGASAWLDAVFDALEAGESDAAAAIAAGDLPWPEPLRQGLAWIRERIARPASDRDAIWELATTIGDIKAPDDDEIAGWKEYRPLDIVVRADRLAAWAALRLRNDPEAALARLEMARATKYQKAAVHAAYAEYLLYKGDLEGAAGEARRATELSPEEPDGHLALGVWAELCEAYKEADRYYRAGLSQMALPDVARFHRRLTLVEMPGRALLAASRLLLDAYPADAAAMADSAIVATVRGSERYPDAAAYAQLSRALAKLGDDRRAEAAEAAIQAGLRFGWGNDLGRAMTQYKRAMELDPSVEQAGWLLADGRTAQSLPLGRPANQERLAKAKEAWEGWAATLQHPPRGDTSWAYLTRAVIADVATQRPAADRRAGIWEAITYVEKALVHDRVDAQRWGYAAQYLRYAELEQLAFEAVEEGYARFATDRTVLAERLPLLANRGDFQEAEALAHQMVAMFGEDPWVSAVQAWLALKGERWEDALEALALPMRNGGDKPWYLEMRARADLGLGRPDDAAEDYRQLLELAEHTPPVDGTTKCRLAIATVVAGNAIDAADWLADARKDHTTRRAGQAVAEALIAFATGDLKRGANGFAQAIEGARSIVELDDIADGLVSRLVLLPAGEGVKEAEIAARGVIDRAVPARRSYLEANEPTAEAELKAALKSDEAEASILVQTALRAVSGRRHLMRNRWAEAAAEYERLLGSTFEPEAKLGLTTSLRQEVEDLQPDGDADAVEEAFARLCAVGGATAVEKAVAVARAQHAAGQLEKARRYLAAHSADAKDDDEREALAAAMAELELSEGAPARAAHSLNEALTTAADRGDRPRAAQLAVRLAVTSLADGDRPTARENLHTARDSWEQEAAVAPAEAVLEELRVVTKRVLLGTRDYSTVDSLITALERARREGTLEQHFAEIVDGLDSARPATS